jgi:hypothetical protein
MEKVAGNYYSVAPLSTANTSPSTGSLASLERSPSIRGHHSGVHKAVEAHRQMVEERQNRKVRRDRSLEAFEAQQPNELVIADQVTQESAGMGSDSRNYEGGLIEPIESEAKTAAVQAFQAQEPDRPFIGEPVPKGSYIDVQV